MAIFFILCFDKYKVKVNNRPINKFNNTENTNSSSGKNTAVFIPAMHNESKDTFTSSSKEENKVRNGILTFLGITAAALLVAKTARKYSGVLQPAFSFGFKKAKTKSVSDSNIEKQMSEARELMKKQQSQLNNLYKDLTQGKHPKR